MKIERGNLLTFMSLCYGDSFDAIFLETRAPSVTLDIICDINLVESSKNLRQSMSFFMDKSIVLNNLYFDRGFCVEHK